MGEDYKLSRAMDWCWCNKKL